MPLLLLVLGLFLALAVLSRLASNWLLSALGVSLYTVLFWPGVIVHELSHAIGALLTGTPVRKFSVLPHDFGNRRVFGSVWHDRTQNPLKLIVISSAPLLFGTFALYLIARSFLPPLSLLPLPETLQKMLNHVWDIGMQEALGLYLTAAVTVHLSPSNDDLKQAAFGVALLMLCGLLIHFIGLWLGINLKDAMFQLIEPAFDRLLLVEKTALLLVLILALASALLRLAKRILIKR